MKTSKSIFTLVLICIIAIAFSCNRTATYGGNKKGGSGDNFSVGKKSNKHIQHQNTHKK